MQPSFASPSVGAFISTQAYGTLMASLCAIASTELPALWLCGNTLPLLVRHTSCCVTLATPTGHYGQYRGRVPRPFYLPRALYYAAAQPHLHALTGAPPTSLRYSYALYHHPFSLPTTYRIWFAPYIAARRWTHACRRDGIRAAADVLELCGRQTRYLLQPLTTSRSAVAGTRTGALVRGRKDFQDYL